MGAVGGDVRDVPVLDAYVQDVLGYSPLEAGVRFLPITLLSFFVAPIAGRLTGRVPARVLLGLGLILVGVGLLLMRGIELGDDWTTLLPGFLVAGVGIGLTNPAIASTAIGVVAPFRAGMASGISNTFRQVGIATGVAALGAIFQSRINSRLAELLPARRRGSARRCRPAAVARRSSRCPGKSRAGCRRRQSGVHQRLQRHPAGRGRDSDRRGSSGSRSSARATSCSSPAARRRPSPPRPLLGALISKGESVHARR